MKDAIISFQRKTGGKLILHNALKLLLLRGSDLCINKTWCLCCPGCQSHHLEAQCGCKGHPWCSRIITLPLARCTGLARHWWSVLAARHSKAQPPLLFTTTLSA